MAAFVYVACALLSFSCAFLLFRGYKANGFRLLFWASLGFVGFALNNTLLLADQFFVPNYDLSVIRTIPAFIGMIVLLYGLISETV